MLTVAAINGLLVICRVFHISTAGINGFFDFGIISPFFALLIPLTLTFIWGKRYVNKSFGILFVIFNSLLFIGLGFAYAHFFSLDPNVREQSSLRIIFNCFDLIPLLMLIYHLALDAYFKLKQKAIN